MAAEPGTVSQRARMCGVTAAQIETTCIGARHVGSTVFLKIAELGKFRRVSVQMRRNFYLL